MTEPKPYTLDRVVRLVIASLLILASFYFIQSVKNALLPFFIAWLLAYLINPLVHFIQVKLRVKNRVVSVVLSLLLLIVGLAGLILILIPTVSTQVEHLREAVAALEANANTKPLIPEEVLLFINKNFNSSVIEKFISTEDIKSFIKIAIPKVGEFLGSTFNLLLSIGTSLIALIYLVFILIDYEKITHGWIRLIPQKRRELVSEIAYDVKRGMNSYFRGQALVAFIMGVLFSIGFTIIGLPMAIILGMFIGLLNMVPYLQIAGIIPLAFLSFLKAMQTGDSFLTIFALGLLVIGIAQVIQDTFLVPKIMGKVTGLNPAIILLSLSIWGSLLGIIGMIIALPMTTLLLSYYKRFILKETINEETLHRKPTQTS